MDRRQGVDGNGMFAFDRKLIIPVVQQGSAQNPNIDMEVSPAKPQLDGDFPNTRRTEKQLVAGIFDQGTGGY